MIFCPNCKWHLKSITKDPELWSKYYPCAINRIKFPWKDGICKSYKRKWYKFWVKSN